MKLVLLDRDGVLNVDRADYVRNPGELVLLPGAAAAVARLNAAGILVAVCTNQSPIGRGIFDEAMLARIHEKLREELARERARLDAIFHCPDAPGRPSRCRKPAPGMLTDALARFGAAARDTPFIGDTASNMGRSFTEGAKLFGYQLLLASPKGYHPADDVLKHSPGHVHLVSDPKEAVREADVVITDVWTSMGQEAESKKRLAELAGYQVDAALMSHAKAEAIFLHCLPAHRGEEVAAEIIDGPQSAVWDEAENRLHVQKALIETLVQASERLREMGPALKAARG